MKKNIKKSFAFLAALATPFAVSVLDSKDAQAATGWVQSGNTWYFYDNNGELKTNGWVGNYYLGADGKMVTNAWIGQYYVDANGAWVKDAHRGWISSNGAWYYYNDNSQLVKNAWIGNYYLGADGRMATNAWVDNNRYYVDANGAWVPNAQRQQTGWVKENNTWYYYNAQGQQVRNAWIGSYYLKADGRMAASEWIYDSSYKAWYYLNSNGSYARNTWAGNYWLNSDGKMATSAWVDNNKYYVGANGAWVPNAQKEEVKNGWVKENNTWYYYKNGGQVKNAWAGNYWLGADGRMATNAWVDNDKYYVDANGAWVKDAKKDNNSKSSDNQNKDASKSTADTKKTGWQSENNAWYYYNKDGNLVKNAWAGSYYLKADGRMAANEWIYDNSYKAWYYLKSDGSYARNAWVGDYWLGADGKMATNSWVDNGRYFVDASGKWENTNASYYKVTSLHAPIYNANGQVLANVSRDTVVFRRSGSVVNNRIPVESAGVAGYMNLSQLSVASEAETPYYYSDGTYVYHKYPNVSVAVAHHNANMQIGKKYYSADGINFGSFKLDHPFQFDNLKSKTNYSAEDLNRLYELKGSGNSKLAGKGATFKAAEARYGVNALYLVAHSALESAWGKSKIAQDKNNFFGISAYDSNPYNSATKFDDVDAGILGAARWINERYLTSSNYPARGAYLGNKAGGMNVNYATAPYWGESIASIMFDANERLGRKDG